ncbi:hypothetical protein MASR1M97_14740 [Candidatus Desulfobacillus denitrificans]
MGEIILWLAMTSRTTIVPLLAATLLGACSAPQPKPPSSGHIDANSAPAAKSNIPQPVQQTVAVPKPRPAAKAETYSVVVKDVKVEELLFALARDAKLNVDIHPGIRGTVTLNAIDQTLPQLLNRIAKQVDMRFELDGPNLVVMPDSPYLRTYKVDYVNMSRDTTGNVAINTQIASISPTAAGAGGAGAAAGGTSGNVSSTKVDNVAKNRFWETLEQNIKDILRETDKEIIVKRRVAEGQEQAAAAGAAAQPGAAGAGTGTAGAPTQIQVQVAPPQQPSTAAKEYETLQAASVMMNRETGFVMARATSRQHEKIQEFLDKVLDLGTTPGADRSDHRRGAPQPELPAGHRLAALQPGRGIDARSARAARPARSPTTRRRANTRPRWRQRRCLRPSPVRCSAWPSAAPTSSPPSSCWRPSAPCAFSPARSSRC